MLMKEIVLEIDSGLGFETIFEITILLHKQLFYIDSQLHSVHNGIYIINLIEMIKKIKQLWQHKEIRTFIWNLISLFIWTTITLVTNDVIHLEEPWLSLFFLAVVPSVTQLMKDINKKYFNDLWVTDETKVNELQTKIAKLQDDLEDKE